MEHVDWKSVKDTIEIRFLHGDGYGVVSHAEVAGESPVRASARLARRHVGQTMLIGDKLGVR